MSNNSINTNVGAIVALQNLNATQAQLMTTQSRINTGMKVASAKDNGSIWAIAQNQRAISMSLNAVKDSLSRGSSTIDVALAAGSTVSDLLLQMKEKVLAASDSSLDQTSRDALNEDFKSLRDQLQKSVDNAEFNGSNLIDGSITDLQALANADGSSKLTVNAENLSLGGGVIAVNATDTIGTVVDATNMITNVETSIQATSAALARLGSGAHAYDLHTVFVGKLQDALDTGVGNLVDADLAKESAKLQALQTKQQLGVQALSIANQSPQIVLSLFK
ncbi:MAG: flagellin [Caulobacter sp.]|nr:flagellin [Caulobacter sp.]